MRYAILATISVAILAGCSGPDIAKPQSEREDIAELQGAASAQGVRLKMLEDRIHLLEARNEMLEAEVRRLSPN